MDCDGAILHGFAMSFPNKPIGIGKLLLDTENNRNLPQKSQPAAHASMIEEQGRKLVVMANDIINYGLNPFDWTMVVDAGDGNGDYIVVEGNRRFCAMNLVLHPELAAGTKLETAFKKLNKESAAKIPTIIECIVAPHKTAASFWVRRKHGSDLGGAGTDAWGAISKARADHKEGIARPDLDAINFVLSQQGLDPDVQKVLDGSKFNITTLDRLIRSKDVQAAVGFKLQDEKLVSDNNKTRITEVFIDLVTIIAKGEHKGKEFTERDVDTEDKRDEFLKKVLTGKPNKIAASAWEISGKPKSIKLKKSTKTKANPTTQERTKLIPREFKLEIHDVKINDIFGELKRLDIESDRHAVSVLFRVFVQFTIDEYVKKFSVPVKRNAKGWVEDSMGDQIKLVEKDLSHRKIMTYAELKPLRQAVSDTNSLIAPETLNAYVHSKWMHPDPLQLKISWNTIQLFMERVWAALK